VADRREVALQIGEERALGAALQHLGQKGAAGRQHGAGEIRRRLGEADDAQVVGLLVAGGVGGHVGQDEVCRPADEGHEALRRVRIEEIEGDELRA
jgi:hypothetical protein